MRHPDDGTVMALLDGEIPSDELATITRHLQECAECQARLEAARTMMADTDTLVTLLDAGAAPADGARHPLPLPLPRRGWTTFSRNLAWAATVVLAAGLGYTMRGGDPALLDSVSVMDSDLPTAPVQADAVEVEPDPPTTARAVVPPPAPPATTITPEHPAQDARREAFAGAQKSGADVLPPAPPPILPRATGRTQARLAAPAAEPAPMALAERAADVAVESFAPIGFAEAIARLGGTIRLVDGLVPDRLEASAMTVRVVYPLQTGELLLEQRRLGDSVTVTLRGPVSADSLAVLRGRIR